MNQEATGSSNTWGIKCPSEALSGTGALISLNSVFPAGCDPLPISGSVKGVAFSDTMGWPPMKVRPSHPSDTLTRISEAD